MPGYFSWEAGLIVAASIAPMLRHGLKPLIAPWMTKDTSSAVPAATQPMPPTSPCRRLIFKAS